MLRAFSLAMTLTFAAPALAVTDTGTTETSDKIVVAQQAPVAPVPKRDCEKTTEGVS